MSDAKWFVIHTYSGYENKVKTNIEKMVENRRMQDQILDVKVPTRIVVNEQKKEVEEKIFPSYVFVKAAVTYDEEKKETSMSDNAWFVIRNTRGVTGFVGPESKATPLAEEEVAKYGVEDKQVEVSYAVGDTVEIIEGPFIGQKGTVLDINTKDEIAKISAKMFGRETELEVDIYGLELCEID